MPTILLLDYHRHVATAKKPNRSTDSAILIRCTSEQKDLFERAVAKVQEGLPPGAKISLSGFALEHTLLAAKKVLGIR